MHREVRYADSAIRIAKPFDATLTLEGRGLLLVPSAFTWPAVMAITEPPWQPTVVYPARGVGALWEASRPVSARGLRALLGARRADVLADFSAPRSTTELARRLGVSPASVSQHLAVLRDAGLVTTHRVGRVVLYMRTPIGDALATRRGAGGLTARPPLSPRPRRGRLRYDRSTGRPRLQVDVGVADALAAAVADQPFVQ